MGTTQKGLMYVGPKVAQMFNQIWDQMGAKNHIPNHMRPKLQGRGSKFRKSFNKSTCSHRKRSFTKRRELYSPNIGVCYYFKCRTCRLVFSVPECFIQIPYTQNKKEIERNNDLYGPDWRR